MIQEQAGRMSDHPDSFPEWMTQIQGEYANLTELYEKERGYAAKMSRLVSLVQQEVGSPIPLSRAAFSNFLPVVHTAFLGSDAIVLMVDPSGAKTSRDLSLMPLDVVLAVVHECTFELRRSMSEKRRQLSKRIHTLEKVAVELGKLQGAAERTDYEEAVDPKSVEEPGEVKVAEAQAANRETKAAEEDFKFSGSYQERRQALNGQQFPFTRSQG